MNTRTLICMICAALLISARATGSEIARSNILFCIADDASMKSFGAYGCKFIKTPAIDRLAREGLVFSNAYHCNPKCAPARACLVLFQVLCF